MRFSCRFRAAGFSLIELIIVIAVVIILAATAATRFDLSTKNLDAVAKNLRSNIQLAQDLAMTNGSVYGFRSINATSYEIYNGAPGTPARDPLSGGNLTVSISTVQFFGIVPTVPFTASGVPNIAANATIVLTEESAQRTVVIEQNTGHTRMTNP